MSQGRRVEWEQGFSGLTLLGIWIWVSWVFYQERPGDCYLSFVSRGRCGKRKVLRQVCRLRQEWTDRCVDSGKRAHTGVQSREHKGMVRDFKSPALQPKLTVLWADREHSQYLTNRCLCVLGKKGYMMLYGCLTGLGRPRAVRGVSVGEYLV